VTVTFARTAEEKGLPNCDLAEKKKKKTRRHCQWGAILTRERRSDFKLLANPSSRTFGEKVSFSEKKKKVARQRGGRVREELTALQGAARIFLVESLRASEKRKTPFRMEGAGKRRNRQRKKEKQGAAEGMLPASEKKKPFSAWRLLREAASQARGGGKDVEGCVIFLRGEELNSRKKDPACGERGSR